MLSSRWNPFIRRRSDFDNTYTCPRKARNSVTRTMYKYPRVTCGQTLVSTPLSEYAKASDILRQNAANARTSLLEKG
eukprot:589051-Amorphochlora_amoeboformis.AAC.1